MYTVATIFDMWLYRTSLILASDAKNDLGQAQKAHKSRYHLRISIHLICTALDTIRYNTSGLLGKRGSQWFILNNDIKYIRLLREQHKTG